MCRVKVAVIFSYYKILGISPVSGRVSLQLDSSWYLLIPFPYLAPLPTYPQFVLCIAFNFFLAFFLDLPSVNTEKSRFLDSGFRRVGEITSQFSKYLLSACCWRQHHAKRPFLWRRSLLRGCAARNSVPLAHPPVMFALPLAFAQIVLKPPHISPAGLCIRASGFCSREVRPLNVPFGFPVFKWSKQGSVSSIIS